MWKFGISRFSSNEDDYTTGALMLTFLTNAQTPFDWEPPANL